MKTALFARPNLKVFLCFGLVLALFQHIIMAGDSPEPLVADVRAVSPGTIDRMISRSLECPTVEGYMIVSDYYRQLGDTGRAMAFLRRAALLAECSWE